MKNYFSVLGVTRQMARSEVRQAFLKLASELHPDKCGDTPESNTKFADITVAYTILTTEAKRKIYLDELALFTNQCPTCDGHGAVRIKRGFQNIGWSHCANCDGCGRVNRRST